MPDEYIPRKAALKAIYTSTAPGLEVKAMPAADVMEVVHANWEWDPDGIDWGIGAWKCSNCGSKAETWWAKDGNSNPLKCAGSHYCGNCGATMRK